MGGVGIGGKEGEEDRGGGLRKGVEESHPSSFPCTPDRASSRRLLERIRTSRL